MPARMFSFALLKFLSLSILSAAAPAAERISLPESWLDLSFSRVASGASVTVSGRSALLLRADRDIERLKVELRPGGDAEQAGRWQARLVSLPATEEPAAPDLSRVAERDVRWRFAGTVSRARPPDTTVEAVVPRPGYRNWLLLLEPAGADPQATVEVRVQARPVDEAARLNWLVRMRATYNPDAERDRVRELVRFLTDAEVRHWTGLRDRQAFLAVWARVTSREQINAAYPGPEGPPDLYRMGHSLPNGLLLHLGGVRVVPPGR